MAREKSKTPLEVFEEATYETEKEIPQENRSEKSESHAAKSDNSKKKKTSQGKKQSLIDNMPDYDIIRSFDVMLAFLPQVIWHRRSREPTSLRFFIHTAEHDREVFVIPVQQGKEKMLVDYANDTFAKEKCIVVFFYWIPRNKCKKSMRT